MSITQDYPQQNSTEPRSEAAALRETPYAHAPAVLPAEDVFKVADALGASAIFNMRRIRAVRNAEELRVAKEEYSSVFAALSDLRISLNTHEARATLAHRSLRKRLTYTADNLRKELVAAEARIPRSTRSTSAPKTKAEIARANAKLLASFIIQEAKKLSAIYAPDHTKLLRVSSAPASAFSNNSAFTRLIRVEDPETLAAEVDSFNPLEGMDALL